MRSVLVIGAGWAGISAAMAAAERGWTVHIVEERPFIGGRSRSFVDKTTGETIDNGQHLMMGCYHSALSILERLETRSFVELQRHLCVPFVDARETTILDAGRLPGSLGVALGIARLKGLSVASRLKILRLAVKIKLGMVKADGWTCSEFLEQHRQTTEGIARFWEPIILATLNSPADKADATLLLAVMNLAFMGSSTDSKLAFPKRGLSELLSPLPEWLAKRGGFLRTSTRCERLELVGGNVVGAKLSDGSEVIVDAVITAIPHQALKRVEGIDSGLVSKWDSETSPIISVYLWYSEAWMTSDFAAALGTTIQWIFNRRQISDEVDIAVSNANPGHVSLTISAGAEIATHESGQIIDEADAELRLLFPSMKSARLTHGLVIKEKRATPLITPSVIRPRSNALHSLASNLWIAGDWVDTGLPATIEGAAVSGARAAELMCDAMPIGQDE